MVQYWKIQFFVLILLVYYSDYCNQSNRLMKEVIQQSYDNCF